MSASEVSWIALRMATTVLVLVLSWRVWRIDSGRMLAWPAQWIGDVPGRGGQELRAGLFGVTLFVSGVLVGVALTVSALYPPG